MRASIYKRVSAFFLSAFLFGFSPAMAQPVDDVSQAESALDAAEEQLPTDCDPAAMACDAADPESGMAPSELRIDAPFGNAWLGAADGDVTLVIFADYACPACREAQPVIDQLIAQDPKLKVVYRVLVNEDEGREAALTSLAVAKASPDWSKFHHALDAGGQPDSRSIAKALAGSGIDRAGLPQIKELDASNMEIFDEVSNNGSLVAQRNGQAIPAWVIGDADALNGFELEPLQAAIAAARARTGQD